MALLRLAVMLAFTLSIQLCLGAPTSILRGFSGCRNLEDACYDIKEELYDFEDEFWDSYEDYLPEDGCCQYSNLRECCGEGNEIGYSGGYSDCFEGDPCNGIYGNHRDISGCYGERCYDDIGYDGDYSKFYEGGLSNGMDFCKDSLEYCEGDLYNCGDVLGSSGKDCCNEIMDNCAGCSEYYDGDLSNGMEFCKDSLEYCEGDLYNCGDVLGSCVKDCCNEMGNCNENISCGLCDA